MAKSPRSGGQVLRPRPIPQRTCVACRQGNAKRELVRVVRTVDGAVVVDPTGKKSGRGAYVCHTPACWAAALEPKRGILTRALKVESIGDDDRVALVEYASGVGTGA